MRLKVAVLLNISILISFSKQNDTTTNNNSVIVTNSDVKNINFYVGDTNNSADNEYIIKRNKIETRASCTPNVTLLDCNTKNESHEKWNWHQKHKFIIKSITESNCPLSNLTFQWTTKTKNREAEQYPEFKNKQAFILYPFSLEIGNYTLELNVTESAPDKEIGTQSVKCNIRIIPETPFPMIMGGRSRTLPSGENFTVKARGDERYKHLNVTYHWTCQATPINDFCTGFIEAEKYLSDRYYVDTIDMGHFVHMLELSTGATMVDFQSFVHREVLAGIVPVDYEPALQILFGDPNYGSRTFGKVVEECYNFI